MLAAISYGSFALAAESVTGIRRLPEIPASFHPTVVVTIRVRAMWAIAIVARETGTHVDSAGKAADARFVYLAWNMHSVETTDLAATISAPMTASTSARLASGVNQ